MKRGHLDRPSHPIEGYRAAGIHSAPRDPSGSMRAFANPGSDGHAPAPREARAALGTVNDRSAPQAYWQATAPMTGRPSLRGLEGAHSPASPRPTPPRAQAAPRDASAPGTMSAGLAASGQRGVVSGPDAGRGIGVPTPVGHSQPASGHGGTHVPVPSLVPRPVSSPLPLGQPTLRLSRVSRRAWGVH